jgi:hypothetical protein
LRRRDNMVERHREVISAVLHSLHTQTHTHTHFRGRTQREHRLRCRTIVMHGCEECRRSAGQRGEVKREVGWVRCVRGNVCRLIMHPTLVLTHTTEATLLGVEWLPDTACEHCLLPTSERARGRGRWRLQGAQCCPPALALLNVLHSFSCLAPFSAFGRT